jgi:hypothetical protein
MPAITVERYIRLVREDSYYEVIPSRDTVDGYTVYFHADDVSERCLDLSRDMARALAHALLELTSH